MTWTLDSSAVTLDSTLFTMDGGAQQWAAAPGAVAGIASGLTQWATVTLTAPLYAGIGGILDGYLWTSPVPGVGTTIYYDPTFIAIAPNGEISSTSNNCSAVVQFYSAPAGWTLGLVSITPAFVSYAQATASMSASLASPAPALASQLGAVAALAADMSAQIALAAAPGAAGAQAAALSSGVTLAAQIGALAAQAASLTAGAALRAQLSAVSSQASTLTARIAFAAAPGAIAHTSGALSTRTRFAATPGAVSAQPAALSATAARFAAGLEALAAQAATLSTKIPLTAVPGARAALNATISAYQRVSATPGAIAALRSTLSTGAGFRAVPGAIASFHGALSSSVFFNSIPQAVASLGAALSTTPVYTMPILLSHQVPGIYQPGPEPFGQFPVGAGEVSVYAIDWTYWVSFLWQPGFSATTGYVVRPFPWTGLQYVCTTAGQTGAYAPTWPTAAGFSVLDGSVVWQAEAVDSTSLQTTLVDGVWTSSDPSVVVTAYAPIGELAPVLVDLSGAVPGSSYTVECRANFANGDFLIGHLVFDVA